MRTKVEITGINTSELTVIPSEQVIELIRRSQEGDYEARDELVHGNIKLSLSHQKFNNRGENVDDLFQVGAMVLLKPSTISIFPTMLSFHLCGADDYRRIRRYLRDNSKIQFRAL